MFYCIVFMNVKMIGDLLCITKVNHDNFLYKWIAVCNNVLTYMTNKILKNIGLRSSAEKLIKCLTFVT